jgi:hypothetical protein
MVCGPDDDNLILFNLLIMEEGMFHLGSDHSKFHVPLQHLLDDFLGIGNLEREFELGMLFIKIPHPLRKEIFSGNGARSQREFSPDPLGKFAQSVHQVFTDGENLGSEPEENLSGFGEMGLAAFPVKKTERERFLKGEDMTADRWLTEKEILRRPGETS